MAAQQRRRDSAIGRDRHHRRVAMLIRQHRRQNSDQCAGGHHRDDGAAVSEQIAKPHGRVGVEAFRRGAIMRCDPAGRFRARRREMDDRRRHRRAFNRTREK